MTALFLVACRSVWSNIIYTDSVGVNNASFLVVHPSIWSNFIWLLVEAFETISFSLMISSWHIRCGQRSAFFYWLPAKELQLPWLPHVNDHFEIIVTMVILWLRCLSERLKQYYLHWQHRRQQSVISGCLPERLKQLYLVACRSIWNDIIYIDSVGLTTLFHHDTYAAVSGQLSTAGCLRRNCNYPWLPHVNEPLRNYCYHGNFMRLCT